MSTNHTCPAWCGPLAESNSLAIIPEADWFDTTIIILSILSSFNGVFQVTHLLSQTEPYKAVKAISKISTFIILGSDLLWLVYGLMKGDSVVFASGLASSINAILIAILVFGSERMVVRIVLWYLSIISWFHRCSGGSLCHASVQNIGSNFPPTSDEFADIHGGGSTSTSLPWSSRSDDL